MNKGTIVFNDDMGTFLMLSENGIQRYLPRLSECNVFSLVGRTTPTVGGEAETQISPPVDAVAEYVPDWPGVPEPFDHVAVDEDGRGILLCWLSREKARKWRLVSDERPDKDVSYITEIPEPPGDTWKQMIYQRPK